MMDPGNQMARVAYNFTIVVSSVDHACSAMDTSQGHLVWIRLGIIALQHKFTNVSRTILLILISLQIITLKLVNLPKLQRFTTTQSN